MSESVATIFCANVGLRLKNSLKN